MLGGCSRVLRVLGSRGFSSAATKYDLVVVGGGPGGYVAAIKAAQLGLKTACVESRGTLGGTCLNVGCIPSKALLNASHKYHEAIHDFKKLGIDCTASVNLKQMMAQKDTSVAGLTGGIEYLFKKNGVTYVKGLGKITGPERVSVALNAGGEETLDTKKILIATGSEPASLPNVPVDEKRIVTSTGALALSSIPKSMVVIGGGVIGLEMGSVWARLGSKVTVVEFLDRLIPGNDLEIAGLFKDILAKQGFQFKMSTKVLKADPSGSDVKLTVAPAAGGAEEVLSADVVLLATGRRPFTKGLGLETVGVKMDGLRVATNDHYQTNIPSIYAIGDVIKGPMLAHKAEDEGIACAELLAGKAGHVNYDAIPGVIYTHPEVASVGKTEEELKAAKVNYVSAKYPFMANSRARTNNDFAGVIKILSDKATDRMLGVHIIGPGAGEMIAEAVVGLEYGASCEDIARTCHAHPTLSEGFREACMLAQTGKAIHF